MTTINSAELIAAAVSKVVLIDSPCSWGKKYGYSIWYAEGNSEFFPSPVIETSEEIAWLEAKKREMGEEGKQFTIAGTSLVRIETLQAAKFSVSENGQVRAYVSFSGGGASLLLN